MRKWELEEALEPFMDDTPVMIQLLPPPDGLRHLGKASYVQRDGEGLIVLRIEKEDEDER